MTDTSTSTDPRLAAMTVEEKCRLLGGASTWRTHGVERAGIPALKMSDGPNGVRGDGLGALRTPGVVIPAGIALGATWNPDLVGRLGDLLGREAVRKGAHVLLAPTVNLQRTPIGGRVFECMSEDPELTAALCVPYIRGVQDHDVAVTVKHFVVNDTEIDRMTVDVDIDEVPLRELYLRPFEAAIRDAGAWGVMSAYNRLRGEHCANSRYLLTEVLRDDWGFDGFVVSDWFGSHDTVASAAAGLNVPMPGPRTIYGTRLLTAVEAGEVDEATVDALVVDLLRLVDRVRADERPSERPEETVDDPAERELCRQAAAEGVVLVRNTGVLPIRDGASVALVGPNASDTRIMGGGSASLQPISAPSVLDALGDRIPGLVHERGVRIDRLPPPMGPRVLRTPEGEPGLRVRYRNSIDGSGDVVFEELSPSSMLRFFGSAPAGVDPNGFHVTLEGTFVPEHDGPHEFNGVLTGAGTIRVGDATVLDDPGRDLDRGPLFFGMGSVAQSAVVECCAGEPVPVHITNNGIGGFSGIRLGVRVPDPADMFDRAVAAAADADVAVVVVGTNDEWETEGEDRATMDLPGDQDELVRRVAAANPDTVVVVNAGGPVTMPWADDVAAVLVASFGGQELGEAVADVLTGRRDPGGRLPITYPQVLEDTPAWPHYAPVDGVQHYGEGLLMGYRGFDAAGTEPRFAFGHGLSYGTAAWGAPAASAETVDAGSGVEVVVPVTATGERDATDVDQEYVAAPDGAAGRAPKQLVGFAKRVVEAGATDDVTVVVPPTAFRRWDAPSGAWTVDPGRRDLIVASSAAAADEHARVSVTVG